MGQRKYDFVLLYQTAQLLGVLELRCEWLVADDVEATLDEGFGDRKVQMVRRDDGDEVDALISRQGGFPARHFFEAGIDAVGGKTVRVALTP